MAGNPVIDVASEDDYARIVEILLAHGAKVDVMLDKLTMMHLAGHHCGARVMKALIKAGGNPSVRTNATPLHAVAVAGRGETAKVLLDAGADIRALNDGGDMPIHLAARYANSEVMKVLLEHRAPVEVRSREYQATPLHYAALFNSPECVRLLVDAGAIVDARDGYNSMPLILVVDVEHTMETFKEKGPQYDGRHLVRAHDLKSRLTVIQLLIEGGAKPTIQTRSKAGELIPLIEMARRHGTPEIVELLQNPPPATKRPRKP